MINDFCFQDIIIQRRDIITKRGEALEKISNKVTTKGVMERTIVQLQRKINQVMKVMSVKFINTSVKIIS